jgi:hypothetical protein
MLSLLTQEWVSKEYLWENQAEICNIHLCFRSSAGWEGHWVWRLYPWFDFPLQHTGLTPHLAGVPSKATGNF